MIFLVSFQSYARVISRGRPSAVSRAAPVCIATIQTSSALSPWAQQGTSHAVMPQGKLSLNSGKRSGGVFASITTKSNCPATLTFSSTNNFQLVSTHKKISYTLSVSNDSGSIIVNSLNPSLIDNNPRNSPVTRTISIDIPPTEGSLGFETFSDLITTSYSVN